MTPIPSEDDEKLQRFYDTSTKYHPAPVPAPLNRGRAAAFVQDKVKPDLSPEKLRKLVLLAVFYDLRETAGAFAGLLKGGESEPVQIARSALALIALAWIGDEGQQARARGYYHGLQDRADIIEQRDIMLEVVEALGPREGTAYHRQWVQSSINNLGQTLKQAQADNKIPAAKLAQEKINTLTEYLNIQLPRVDRAFSIRQRIDGVDASNQVRPLVILSLGNTTDATPPLVYWSSMRLLRVGQVVAPQIAAEFARQAASLVNPDQEMYRARALRAAEFFGYVLTDADREVLAAQPDTLTDPLVMRPDL